MSISCFTGKLLDFFDLGFEWDGRHERQARTYLSATLTCIERRPSVLDHIEPSRREVKHLCVDIDLTLITLLLLLML